MKTIWKYTLNTTDRQVLNMPKGGMVLDVQAQGELVRAWVLLDPQAPLVPQAFNIYGTGHTINGDPGEYVGSYQLHGGALVFHVFHQGELQ